MEYFLIYLIGTVDGFIEIFRFIGSIGAIGCLVLFFMFRAQDADPYNNEKEKATFRRTASKYFKGFVLFLVLFISTQLIPNSKTLIAMATIPPVINNEQVQELPENVLGFINDYLKDKRHELQGIPSSPDEV